MQQNTNIQPPHPEWLADDEIDTVPGTKHRLIENELFESVLDRAMSRRRFLQGASTGALAAATFVMVPNALMPQTASAQSYGSDRNNRLTFETVEPGNLADIDLPPNYAYNVVVRWGDPILPGAPAFDVDKQTATSQAGQFGFNADLVLWAPLPRLVQRIIDVRGSLGGFGQRLIGLYYPYLKDRSSRSALMIVNHEYTSGADMFRNYIPGDQEQVGVEIEAHGFSIIQVDRMDNGEWRLARRSRFNRRVTGSTPVVITGPLAGHPFLQTAEDPSGTVVRGTLNNCAGGKTPWGTYLTCEENFDQYFGYFDQTRANEPDVAALNERIAPPAGASRRKWEEVDRRFDLSSDATEYNRFGYVVEIDPYDPTAKPKKRTALGRFKHEGVGLRVTADNRIAVYSGDDARFEYVYKFVSKGTVSRINRKANSDLFDDGTLYVARFDTGAVAGDEMGTGEWLELSTNNPALADWTEAEILINTRGAADVAGATPMDRPEDIEVNPVSGSVFVALTNNSRRDGVVGSGATRIVNGREVSSEPNESNPRNNTSGDGSKLNGNQHGHIVEIKEDGNDAGALTFKWNILVKCGDPAVAEHDTRFGNIIDPVAVGVSPIADPDNLVHDSDGNLWISTDGQFFSGSVGFGQNDGVFVVPTAGPGRGLLRQFLSGVPGGEICGPEFSGDERAFFCAIQHPNDGQAFDKIWPIGDRDGVSKPSLIAVREVSGKRIGS
ncbi:PhoX family phosphatase [uncultured Thiohalocapsa sp.]|uniref:PhoX family protein n=1 Tax=uncultured Thiohalocapsa sp. TaxID=768990 RepID=UPI0025E9E202|nr:PhoX family phosphatase [uncultured Thiohalocapsa sp.]